MPENMGGVSPDATVKAVLEALGKRYLVEHGEVSDENGTYWYDRYSDGWVEQFGIVQNIGNITKKEITLPVEFRSSAYHVNWSGRTNADGNATYERKISAQTPKSFQITDFMIWNDKNFYWEAKGFAA